MIKGGSLKAINKQVLKTMWYLKNDSKSLIEDTNYDSFHAYIEGYIDGLSMALNNNLRGEITRFYEEKGNPRTNCYWTNQIKYRNKDKTNTELVEILLDITEEYFYKNPNLFETMDENKIQERLCFWFDGLKNRPGMFIEKRLSLAVYLAALIDGINVYASKNLRVEISNWYNQRSKQIYVCSVEGVEDGTKKLIDVIEEFFKLNQVF